MRFIREVRARVIKRGEIVEFPPTDESGDRRPGVSVRLHDGKAAETVQGWGPAETVFLYCESVGNEIEIGYFNISTKERIYL